MGVSSSWQQPALVLLWEALTLCFYSPHSGSLRFLLIQASWLRPVVVTARTLSPRLQMPVLWIWGFVDFVCVVCELDDLVGISLVLSLCIKSLSSSPHALPPC